MTIEGLAAADTVAAADDERQFCYRHPQRETALSCGRCERPICTNCAIQGPVGFRCRQCGKPAYDPLTSFTSGQLALGAGVALTAGLVSGTAGSLGLLGLCVALFAGGVAAETVRRTIGYKQGPVLAGLLFGGLLIGTLAAYAAVYGSLWLPSMVSEETGELLGYMLVQTGGWALLVGGVACFGAYSRLR
ncbi:MAG TPA: hypothetical protein VMP67_01475 [Candidatus Limnocylindria bacterium]|nr:hypothetical protein [Candidatus Limnocylindria bacterium]